MDPSLPPQTSFEVPQTRPQGDMIPLVPGNQDAHPSMSEMAANPAASGMAQPAQPMAPPAPAQAAQPLPAPVGMTQSLHPGAPDIAGDLDLIEKEWVNKAKAIVAQTRTDPYVQNSEMNKFKADYMKKRYSKDIKLAD